MRKKKDINLLEMYSVYEKLADEHPLYKPHPVKIEAQEKSKTFTFEIDARNIICILAEEKIKHIYLTEPIKSIERSSFKTNKIPLNREIYTIPFLIQKLNSSRFHLQIVSRKAISNYKYYELDGNYLMLTLNDYAHSNDCNKIKISPSQIERFKQGKEQFSLAKRKMAIMKSKFQPKD